MSALSKSPSRSRRPQTPPAFASLVELPSEPRPDAEVFKSLQQKGRAMWSRTEALVLGSMPTGPVHVGVIFGQALALCNDDQRYFHHDVTAAVSRFKLRLAPPGLALRLRDHFEQGELLAAINAERPAEFHEVRRVYLAHELLEDTKHAGIMIGLGRYADKDDINVSDGTGSLSHDIAFIVCI